MNNPNTVNIKQTDETTHWMRYDNKTFEAEDNIASNLFEMDGYGYRKVLYTEEHEKNKRFFGFGEDKVFFDDEWKIRELENLSSLDPNSNDRVILRRLGHLYPTNKELRPKFFPSNDFNEPLRKVQDVGAVPHFLHEMGLFQVSEYKSLFFTQDFQPSGMYHAVVNYNGRWQTDVVDDFIPVYERSGKPIWGMDLEQPWQLILLKLWAKRNYVQAKEYNLGDAKSGYLGVKNSAPFEFVNCFSNSNWKFVNLSLDFDKFVRGHVNRVHKGHFILKTKNSNAVKDSGLIPNEACYELVNLVQQGQARNTASGIKNQNTSKLNNQRPGNYIATIRSSNKTYWAGKKSILDADFKSVHKSVLHQHAESSKYIEEKTVNDKRSQNFALDHYFTVEGTDLKNLFSACYITTRRVGSNCMSGFWKFTYPANRTNAIYLEFNINKETFLDFSIKQLPSNKIVPGTAQSKLQVERYQKQHGGKESNIKHERYLTNKYILVKDNQKSDKTPDQEIFERDFHKLHYETYEIEYLKGYNNGDAHFLKAVKGRYILRLKSEVIPRDAHYVINYCANDDITFREIQPTKSEQTKIMKDAMASTIDKVPSVFLNSTDKAECIAYGNTFDYVGYGYVGAKLKKNSKFQLLIDVDPKMLEQQGYRLKHQYKTETQPFAIVVNPGESTAIVLKRRKDADQKNRFWPPKGIAIFEKR